MHNCHSRHASRETTTSRFEPADYICRDWEGESITAAASRLCLSQPAVSRALQRPADLSRRPFGRFPQGFDLTLRGRKILQELARLPGMEKLVAPNQFDPARGGAINNCGSQ